MASLKRLRFQIQRYVERRFSTLLLALMAVVFILYSFASMGTNTAKVHKTEKDYFTEYIQSEANPQGKASGANGASGLDAVSTHNFNARLLKQYVKEWYDLRPDYELLAQDENQVEYVNIPQQNGIISKSYLENSVSIPPKWLEEVRGKHSLVTGLLREKVKEINKEMAAKVKYSNNHPDETINMDSNLLFKSRGNGAVIVGGHANDETWLALISTRLFRKAGGTLPIEVIIPTREDYKKDAEICDKYLPQLNAQCVILEDILGLTPVIKKFTDESESIEAYIWNRFNDIKKEVAILMSSFDNVLYITPENIMLKPMEHAVFTKQLFKDKGLFVWTDFGLRKTLVDFYKIANVEIGKKKKSEFGLPLTPEVIENLENLSNEVLQDKTNFHDLEGTLPFKQSESSEIIIDKRKHLSTLLLSMYYNFNGHGIYHPLLTGEKEGYWGSKETIIASAHVLGNPYYSINTNVDSNGYMYDDEYHGVSMLQYDPIVDSYSYEAYMKKFSKKGLSKLTWKNYQRWLSASSERRSPLFLNMNNPALRPIELLRDGHVRKENGDRVRLVSSTSYFDNKLETDIWRVMNDYMCYLSIDCAYVNKHFTASQASEKKAFCNQDMKEHLLWVSS